MKNSQQCPKCSSSDLLRIPGKLPMTEHDNMTKISPFRKIYITRYACIHCGFTEEWIESKEDLEKLAKKIEQQDDFSNFV